MVVIAQLVRASDCGSEGRGFEPHQPPANPGFVGNEPGLIFIINCSMNYWLLIIPIFSAIVGWIGIMDSGHQGSFIPHHSSPSAVPGQKHR